MSSRVVGNLPYEILIFLVNIEIVRLTIDGKFARLAEARGFKPGASSPELHTEKPLHFKEVLNDSLAVWMFFIEKFWMKLDTE